MKPYRTTLFIMKPYRTTLFTNKVDYFFCIFCILSILFVFSTSCSDMYDNCNDIILTGRSNVDRGVIKLTILKRNYTIITELIMAAPVTP